MSKLSHLGLRRSCILVSVLFMVSTSIASPISRSQKSEELTSELDKIKSLLLKLEEVKHEISEEDDDVGPPPPLKQTIIATEPMSQGIIDEGPEEYPMYQEETPALKEVSGDSDVITWRDVVKTLEQMKQQNKHTVPKSAAVDVAAGDTMDDLETRTQEGSFGQFRDEIKYSIEKNLLSDMALAVHSGIKMDEILADIMGTQ